MSQREQAIFKRSVQVLREELNPKKIILFGSRAKGTSQEGSDFDFALDCRPPSFAKSHRVKEKLSEGAGLYQFDLTFLPAVSKDFRKIILETGKVVYERRV